MAPAFVPVRLACLLALFATSAACVQPPLEGRRCGSDADCLGGWTCVDEVCVQAGDPIDDDDAGGSPPHDAGDEQQDAGSPPARDGGVDVDGGGDPQDPDGGVDGGPLDGGPLDGGSLDGGSLDGGPLDGGPLFPVELLPALGLAPSGSAFEYGIELAGDPARAEEPTGDRVELPVGDVVAGAFPAYGDPRQGTIVFWLTTTWDANNPPALAEIVDVAGVRMWVTAGDAGLQAWVSISDGPPLPVPTFSDLWSAGEPHLITIRWDTKRPVFTANDRYVGVSVDGSSTAMSGLLFPNPPTPGSASMGARADGTAPLAGRISGLTVYRRPLMAGVFGVDTGRGNELGRILGPPAKSPTSVTGPWDVVLAVPGDQSAAPFLTDGQAWSMPHAASLAPDGFSPALAASGAGAWQISGADAVVAASAAEDLYGHTVRVVAGQEPCDPEVSRLPKWDERFAQFLNEGLQEPLSCASCHVGGDPHKNALDWGARADTPLDWFLAVDSLAAREDEPTVSNSSLVRHFEGPDSTHPENVLAATAMESWLAYRRTTLSSDFCGARVRLPFAPDGPAVARVVFHLAATQTATVRVACAEGVSSHSIWRNDFSNDPLAPSEVVITRDLGAAGDCNDPAVEIDVPLGGELFLHQIEVYPNLVANSTFESWIGATPDVWTLPSQDTSWLRTAPALSGDRSARLFADLPATYGYELSQSLPVTTDGFYAAGMRAFLGQGTLPEVSGRASAFFAEVSRTGPDNKLSVRGRNVQGWQEVAGVARREAPAVLPDEDLDVVGDVVRFGSPTFGLPADMQVDDAFAFALQPVALGPVPADRARSLYDGRLRVDGRDEAWQELGELPSAEGEVRFSVELTGAGAGNPACVLPYTLFALRTTTADVYRAALSEDGEVVFEWSDGSVSVALSDAASFPPAENQPMEVALSWDDADDSFHLKVGANESDFVLGGPPAPTGAGTLYFGSAADEGRCDRWVMPATLTP